MPIISKGETRTYPKHARLELALLYVNYVRDNKKCIQWKEFFIKNRYSTKTWKDWIVTEPELREAHREALEIIGQRREWGASHNKLHYGMQKWQLHAYDEEFREYDIHNANLRTVENTQTADQITNDIKRIMNLKENPGNLDDEMPE